MKKQIVGVAVAAALVFTGCEAWKSDRGRGDAPVGSSNDDPAEVINFPNQFPNVATKCDANGNRIYVHTRSDSAQGATIVVVSGPEADC